MTIMLMLCPLPAFLTTINHLRLAYDKKNRKQLPACGDRLSNDVLIRQL